MRVVFRTDSSLEIGTGHVMRCLALADAMRSRAARCEFVCRMHAGNLIDLIRAQGFEVHALDLEGREEQPAGSRGGLRHSAWLGSDWEIDAGQTLTMALHIPADVVVVDHYAIDARWERAIRRATRKVVVIDDLADRRHECDVLIDQNPGRSAADYASLVPSGCKVHAGPRYALLRPEFAASRDRSLAARSHRPDIKKILVSMGGVDKDNMTGRVLHALSTCALSPDTHIAVLMGAQAPSLQAVHALANTMPWRTDLLVGTRDVAPCMVASDLAIGAMGGTALERCCLGLPTLAFVLADNQRPGADALARLGAIRVVDGGTGMAEDLRAQLAALDRPGALSAMVQASAAVTEGNGAGAIAEALTE